MPESTSVNWSGLPLIHRDGPRNLVDLDVLVELEGLVGTHAARLLVHLLDMAGRQQGYLVVSSSGRQLVDHFSELGVGWSKDKIGKALDSLRDHGLIQADTPRGRFVMPPELVAHETDTSRRRAVTEPIADRDGPYPAHRSLEPSLPAPHVVNEMNDSPNIISHKSVDNIAEMAVRAAADDGVAGPALDLVRAEPLRAMAWVTYVRRRRDHEPATNLGAYVNAQLRRPRTWPPGANDGSALALAVRNGTVVVTTETGATWVPLVSTPAASPPPRPRYATVLDIQAEVDTGLDGDSWLTDSDFVRDVEQYTTRFGSDGYSPNYLRTISLNAALRDRGRLVDREPMWERPGMRESRAL